MSLTEPVRLIVDRDRSGLLCKHPSWDRVELGGVVEVINGFAFPSSSFSKHSGMPLVRIRDVGSTQTDTRFYGPFESRYVVQTGDLLVGMDGDFNCALWGGEQALLNQRVCKLVPVERFINKKFLLYGLPGYLNAINRATSSVTVKHLSSKSIQEISFPLPPLAEQRRIVAAIEEQFSRLDAAVASLERARANLKRHRAAVLQAAVSPLEGWENKKLRQVATIRTGSTPLRSNSRYWNNGSVPWITSAALNNLFVDRPSEFVSEEAVKECRLKKFNPGTLLMAMYGEGQTRGKVAELRIEATTNQAIAAISLSDAHNEFKSFLHLYLRSHYEQLRQAASGGVQPNLNLGIISNLDVPIPPVAEQVRVVADVERRFSVIDVLETSIHHNLKRAERLRQAILKRAFAGKLVPQDPNDEPASVLLERIRAERAKTEGETRSRRSGERRRGRALGQGNHVGLPLPGMMADTDDIGLGADSSDG